MPYNIGVARLSRTWCSTSLWSDLPGMCFLQLCWLMNIELNTWSNLYEYMFYICFRYTHIHTPLNISVRLTRVIKIVYVRTSRRFLVSSKTLKLLQQNKRQLGSICHSPIYKCDLGPMSSNIFTSNISRLVMCKIFVEWAFSNRPILQC